jgi:hypothetical protein
MMKSLFLAVAILFSGISVSAQSKQETSKTPAPNNQKRIMSPQERAIRVLRMMSSKINLSDTQQADVKQILLDRENARAEAKNEDGTIKKEEFKAANKKANDKLQTILSPEQWKQWEAFKAEQKVRREANKTDENNKASRPEMEEDFY